MWRSIRELTTTALLAATYFALAKLGLSMAFDHASATPVWPPTGIALAAVLLLGYRVWPGILLGAFLANLTTEGNVATSLGIATGNTLEAVVGLWLIKRYLGGVRVFEHAITIFRYVGLVAILATAISATIGVSTLALGGFASWREFGPIWGTWWLGDMVSALLIAPLIVVWARQPFRPRSAGQLLEAAALVVVLVLVSGFVFGNWVTDQADDFAVSFLCLPPLLWAAFRFRQAGAVTGTFVISAVAIWGTLRGFGPLATDNSNISLLLVQAFIGTIVMSMLVLSALVSQQIKADEAVRLSQDQLQLVTDSMAAPVTHCSRDLKYVWVSKPYADWLRLPPHQIVGRPIVDIVGPKAFERLRPYIERVLAGETVRYEEEIDFQGLGRRWVSAVYSPTFDGSSQPSGWVAVVLDISDRKQVGTNLSRLAAIVESSTDAIISKTAEGIITSFNPGAERIFGYQAHEVIGKPVSILLPEDRRDEFPAIMERLKQGERIDHYETVRRHKNGSLIDVEVSISPIRDHSGRLIGASKVARDITRRKAMEAHIQARERQQAAIAELGGIALSGIDLQWLMDQMVSLVAHTLDVEMCMILERLPETNEMLVRAGVGWSPGVVGHAKVSTRGDSQAGHTLGSDQPVLVEDLRTESRFTGPALLREHGVVSGMSVAIPGAAARLYGVLAAHTTRQQAFTRDDANFLQSVAHLLAAAIERKQREQELAQHRDHLEELVVERTQELQRTHEHLRLAERMAAMGTLSAGIGHDMGNLLLPIRSRLDALASQDLPEAGKEHLAAVSQCVDYLSSLTRALRLFAQDPQRPAPAETTDLHAWSADVGSLYQSLLPRPLVFAFEIDPAVPPVAISAAGLTQSVLNLIHNAKEAIGLEREGRVVVRAQVESDEFVRLAVEDDGPGMPPEVKSRALEPFFTTKTRRLSTGLGLSLAHGIVQAAGGHLALVSPVKNGRGTAVVLMLPTARAAGAAGIDIQRGPGPIAAVSVADERSRAFLTYTLSSLGLTVVHTNGVPSPDSLLWITNQSSQALVAARRYLHDHPGRSVIVLGHDAPEWTALGAVVIDPNQKFSTVRQRVQEVVKALQIPA